MARHLTLVHAGLALALAACAPPQVYFVTDASPGGEDTLQVIGANGTGQTLIRSLGAGTVAPSTLFVDADADLIFWTDTILGKIFKTNLAGQFEEEVVSGLQSPDGIVFDSGRICWADDGVDTISCADASDGSNQSVLIGAPTGDARGLALDAADDRIYWSNESVGRIFRANATTGASVQEVVSGVGTALGIALDLLNDRVYFADTTGKISRVPMAGGAVEDVVTGLVAPSYVSVKGSLLVWADPGAGVIQRSDLDGGDIRDVATGLVGPNIGVFLSN